MVSYSIAHRLGAASFVQQIKVAGFDGLIFPDLPVEESAPVRAAVAEAGLVLSMLISPTTPADRAERIARASSGFAYVLSRAGITGERTMLAPELPGRLCRLQQVTNLPMAVGFGISNRQQVHQVVQMADAAIVGSALMRRVAEERGKAPAAVVQTVAAFTRELAAGLRGSVGRRP